MTLAALTSAGLTVGGGSGIGATPPVTATTLTLGTPTGGPVTIAGAFNLANVSTLNLQSSGAVSEIGAGAVAVPTLTGNAATATLNGANQIGTLGAFTTTGAFALTDAQALAVAGPLAASSATLSVAGNLTFSGSVTAPTQLALGVSGAVTQTGGIIRTGLLTGNAASLSLTNPANAVTNLGPFLTTGDFTLFDGTSLTVVGMVDPGNVTMNVLGNLAINAPVTGTTVSLTATGVITESTGGLITAATLAGSAQSIALQSANQIATLGDVSARTNLAVNDTQALSVNGAITAGSSLALTTSGSLNLAGAVAAPAVNLTATGSIVETGGSLTAGTLRFQAGGNVTQTGGSLTATVLGASAGGAITLGTAGTANIASTNGLASSVAVRLVDNGPLRVGGINAAPELAITATGQLTVADALITTDGLPLSQQISTTASLPGSYLQVLPDTNGTAVLSQTGVTSVLPYSGTSNTLRLDLPATGGTLTLNALNAPSTNLVLSLGTGTALGTLTALNLNVLGAGGSATLFGQVAGIGGTTAAQISRISPQVSDVYTLNGCAIQAVSCSSTTTFLSTILANITIASLLRPDELVLDVLDLSTTRDRDDPTLLLPNISNRDY